MTYIQKSRVILPGPFVLGLDELQLGEIDGTIRRLQGVLVLFVIVLQGHPHRDIKTRANLIKAGVSTHQRPQIRMVQSVPVVVHDE